ncbi:uncharacterized protein LOC134833830 [Culicoides brevitarsis]|uniref:uncharacterized protein LOC134833830 n=1 Tax=Culicoides brevitarsis TaxID=469753 RepID=UPI00307B4AA0
MTPDLKTLKEDIRAILISSKNGLSISQLEKDYNKINGENIMYFSYGFTSMIDFLKSISDVVSLRGYGNHILLYPVITKATEHINYMVQKQRKSSQKQHRFHYKAFESLRNHTNSCLDEPLSGLDNSFTSNTSDERATELSDFEDDAFFGHYPPNAMRHVDEIVKNCSITEEVEPNEGYYPIRITYIQTPYKLYFQLKNIRFEKANNALQQYYESLDESDFVLNEIDIRKTRVCVAKFEGKWHRAEIVSEELDGEDCCKVFCFDYGEVKLVNRKSLKYLLKDFGSFSRQAYRGKIAYIQPKGIRWSRMCTQKLKDFVHGIWIYGKLEYYSLEECCHYISLFHTYTSQDINVKDYLISNCTDVLESSDVKGKQSRALAIPTFKMLEQGFGTNKELID